MKDSPFNRRQLLQCAVASSIWGATTELFGAEAARTSSSLVRTENERPGSSDWKLTKTGIEPISKYRCPWIEGYCSHTSVCAGETLQFYVSTNPTSAYSIEVYRLGYYGGAGGRRMTEIGPLQGEPLPDPEIGPKRLRDCAWPIAHELTIPDDWPSGVYVGKLTAARDGWQSYIVFIVRDDRPVDLLFQCSDHTWQAYNRWPSQFSLYDDGNSQWFWGPGTQVSFNRPYGKYCQIVDQPLSIGSGEFFLWEFPFVYWLESLGYDVSYISNQDTHRDPGRLQRARGWLSVGHDEYWTIEMYRNVQQAIAAGVSIGFFSGNAVCGRIEYDERVRGFERVGVFGPLGGTQEFDSMSTLPHVRPYANELIGAHSTGPVTGGADWICVQPEHWCYVNTEMRAGDSIPGLIGWEWHGDPAPIEGLEIIASGPTQSAPSQPNGGTYTATIYPGPRNNFVFNAATCWWADGLSEPPGYVRPSVYTTPLGPDRRVQQMTRNILDQMIRGTGSSANRLR